MSSFLIKGIVVKLTSLKFRRQFSKFQDQARHDLLEITRHGRRELVLMSADHYDWLVAAARRTWRTAEAPEIVVDAVRRAEMESEHVALDDLVK